MLSCPNVRGLEFQSVGQLLDHRMRERETPWSLLLRRFSCMGYFSIHSARKRAYGRFSSLVVRACIWERESLSSSPCFNELDIEKLTVEAALLILRAQSVQKLCVNLLNVEIVENASVSLATFYFPFGL